ncbi:MAG: CoA ester lyase [Sphingomonas bacterium]|nr:CoA ester lyase [Sphingomonas bacterium]
MTLNLFARSALLFLPASNPRAVAKARESAADLVVLDLEDAVKPGDKASARAAAVDAVAGNWPMPVAIRVNGFDTAEHDPDLAAALGSGCDFIIVPMVDRPLAISGKPVAAMIETAAGVLAAPAIARSVCALIVGTNDLANSLRLPTIDRAAMAMVLQSAVVAARAAGIAVFDGVRNQLDDPDGLAAECAAGRALGFDGKSLIHPGQIAACQAAFAPTATDIARAERLIAAATGGAERFEGAMIEAMHVESARRLLARR